MTKSAFETKRMHLIDSDLSSVRNEARTFVLNATDRGSEECHFYRNFPDEYDLEKDIERFLPVFAGDYALVVHDLLILRRFAFRRYAFVLARKLNEKIPKTERSRPWLAKDFFLPRAGLAMLVGYGVLLGAGKALEWLYWISEHWISWVLTPALFLLSLWMVYLNVRHQVGKSPYTGRRTLEVWSLCLAWVAVFVMAAWLLSIPAKEHFSLWHAILSGALAFVLAVLGEFFFRPDSSLADPL